MEYSNRLNKRIRNRVRSEVRTEVQIEIEIEKNIEKYREWYQKETAAGNTPVSILAEGDSWFRYMVGKGVVFYVEKLMKMEIQNLAYPGDEVRDMLTLKQRKRLVRELKRGPARRKKYEFFLFSGGGNDLVGIDRFYKWLNPYKDGMEAKDCINNKTLKHALSILEEGYREIVLIRNTYSPSTTLLLHGYDFAIPNGKGVCGKGPWLEPGLKERKIPKGMRREVVKLFLIEFKKILRKIAKEDNVVLVETQGTLSDSEWANELHPKNAGFKKIAGKFVSSMQPPD